MSLQEHSAAPATASYATAEVIFDWRLIHPPFIT